MARTRLYRGGVLEAEDFPLEEISEHLSDPSAVVWADLCHAPAAELELVARELDLHGLAVEDAVSARQRPKLDRYASHLFIAAYGVELDRATGRIGVDEVLAFVTSQALVTVRPADGFDVDAVVERWDSSPDLAKHGVAFLLHGLLDVVVDSHFATVQGLDDEIEDLEDLLFDERPHSAEVQRRSFELRKSLVLARRVVLPMREVVNSLLRRDLQVVDEAMAPYYQDVYDHVLRATEWTESLRDLVGTILETNLTIQGNRLNGIMKKVTSWAAIIAVPTAVTGFYGQNVPYPGFAHASGFWTSLLVMVGLSGGLYAVFKRRDWL
ncbi:magnesium transporter CorA family protein [Kineosporia sp. R_H_3]|uniref:magnesium transporter CorA family protein n=1 Tax=Kineosporia sp. R_H_3 TaxID=1961848 RepID=UPI0018E929D8|nr:magnesium transporter CorA family protein [Kineosporia sp. R_H_3]